MPIELQYVPEHHALQTAKKGLFQHAGPMEVHVCVITPLTGGAIAALIMPMIVSSHKLDQARKTSGHGLLLYAIPGSVWPTDSLLNKFKRLCH